MKKLFTLVFGVLFAMCANAVTLDIGEPNNNTKDAKANQVFFDPATNSSLSTSSGITAQVGGLVLMEWMFLLMMSLF